MQQFDLGHYPSLKFKVNVVYSGDHLKKISISPSKTFGIEAEGPAHLEIQTMIDWLQRYFEGFPRKTPDLPFQTLSSFTSKVMNAISTIPFGETRTYSEIARMVGIPDGARAVGTACGRNPFLIMVPCHRVVAKRGLGGYAAGIEVKKALLKFERWSLHTALDKH